MSAATLPGFRILIVEGEYLLADDLARGLRKVGAVVIGPMLVAGVIGSPIS